MHEIDKEAFGSFLGQLRKEKNWTQKDLAQRLFVSDKAVSKWERGLSLPDVSLLIPLAEALEVSVAELLEGHRLPEAEEMKPEAVEDLVKKAITISADVPQKNKRRVLLFSWCALISVLEMCLGSWLLGTMGLRLNMQLMSLEILGFIFGIYLWFVVEETLPDYYDANPIGTYYRGGFRISLPGVSFNNSNWPKILKAMRIWSLAMLILTPLASTALSFLPMTAAWQVGAYLGIATAALAGLFLPVYLMGRNRETRGKKNPALAASLVVIPLVLLLTWFTGGGEQFSGMKLGYSSSKSRVHWRASYARLDGSVSKVLFPEEEAYLLTVVTNDGSLDISVIGEDGAIVLDREDIPTGEYPLALKDAARVTVRAEGHRGSFALEPME